MTQDSFGPGSYQISREFMAQFEIKLCPDCQLEHAAVRTCDEARDFRRTLEELNASKTDQTEQKES